jgi:hypothetical protein
VLLSAAIRYGLAREIVTPFVLIDELLHAELARGDLFQARGEFMTVTFLYPLLIAPAWLFDSTETAYGVAKATGAVVMSLAAVPVYLWGRRLVAERWALAAAALTLLMPWLILTGTLMAEVAFLPAFLLACFVLGLALERPTIARQAAALACAGLAAATRVQGLIVFAVLATAVLAYDVRAVRRWWPTGVVLGLVALGLPALRGDLDAYGHVDDPDYGAGATLKWLVYDAGALAVAVGLVPLVALVALRPRNERERSFLCVTASATAWLLVLAAVSSQWDPVGIKERYLLHCMPLLFLALVLWLERGAALPRRALVAAGAAVAAIVALPLTELFSYPSFLGNAFGLIPFFRLTLETSHVRALLVVLALAAAAVAVLRPRLALPALALYLLASNAPTFAVLRNHALGVRELAALEPEPAWIDRATDAPVAYLNTSNYAPETGRGDLWPQWAPVWEAQFWNRRADRVISLQYEEPAPLAQLDARVDWSDGSIVGAPPFAYVLADQRFEPVGHPRARRGNLRLWLVDHPLRLETALEGVYADGRVDDSASLNRFSGPRSVRVLLEPLATGAEVTVDAGPLYNAGAVPKLRSATWTRRFPLDAPVTVAVPSHAPPFRVEVHVTPRGAARVRFA